MGTPGMDLSGNSWKPDSEKMGVSRFDATAERGFESKRELESVLWGEGSRHLGISATRKQNTPRTAELIDGPENFRFFRKDDR